MQIIITLLTSAFGSVFTFLAARMGARIAVAAAVVVVYIAAAATFAATINAVAGAILPTMPQLLVEGLSWLPGNTAECIGAMLAGDVAAYIYRQVVIVASIKSRI